MIGNRADSNPLAHRQPTRGHLPPRRHGSVQVRSTSIAKAVVPQAHGTQSEGMAPNAPAPRRYERDSALRKVIVDIGAASSRRHAIPAWFSADLTTVLPLLGHRSLTVYLAGTLAQALARHPRLHAVRDLRGRIVLFDDVDMNLSVEVEADGQPFPMNHVLRSVQSRSLNDLHAEVQAVKAHPERSPTAARAAPLRAYLALPPPLRSRLLGSVRRFPDRQKALMGTVGLTSVGMYGRGGGIGLPFLVHTLDVLVGGLETRAGYDPNRTLGPRQHLSISLQADHDIVDGAPLARFLAEFREDLEQGRALR
jgi:pyruvate/2-oxoglutarate dehydrogenase complex dihydrolipoamide acyltransferase (E2) component